MCFLAEGEGKNMDDSREMGQWVGTSLGKLRLVWNLGQRREKLDSTEGGGVAAQ